MTKIKTYTKLTILIIITLTLVYIFFINKNIIQNKPNKPLTYDDVSSLKNSSGSIKSRLKKLSRQDGRIKTILKNYNDYPEALLDSLSKDIDLLDFVVGYTENDRKVSKEDIEIKEGEIPLLLQWDKRWGYDLYGENIIAISGCAPTSLAMVIQGLTKNPVTPTEIANFSQDNGYYINGTGTSWSLITEGDKNYGVNASVIPLSKEKIYSELNQNHPIICSMREGDFTTQGHFIVLSKIENGKIKVNDPNSKKRSSMLWDYERLAPQIKNLWSFKV